MAEEVPISGGPERAKIRSVLAPALLPYITLGIYLLVWWYKINKEMVELGRKRGTSELGDNPTLSLLALFPGGLLIVPAIWTVVTTYQRSKKAQQLVGVPEYDQLNGWIYAIAYILISPVAFGYLQSGLNKVWQVDSGRMPAGAVPAAAGAPAQPSAPTGAPDVPPPPSTSPVPGVIPETPSVQPPPPPPPAAEPPPPPAAEPPPPPPPPPSA